MLGRVAQGAATAVSPTIAPLTTAVMAQAPNRLHMGLFNLGIPAMRAFGGCGVVLDALPTRVRVAQGQKNALTAELPERARARISEVTDRCSALFGRSYDVEVLHHAPLHRGYGTMTSIANAVVAGCAALADVQLSLAQLVELSGRGGASAIGTLGFFGGGFIVDAGREPLSEYLPSSATRRSSAPVPVVKRELPAEWVVDLIDPPVRSAPEGDDEIAFFRANTPVPANEILETIAVVYQSLVPAIQNGDLSLASSAFTRMRSIGFKRRELQQQSASAALIDRLEEIEGTALGMSSMGPLVFVFREVGNKMAQLHVHAIASDAGATLISGVSPASAGATTHVEA